eukprot:Nitzschia sp. Nitz4//scaffold201_size42423//16500//17150//NITZ4_007373-RA/size42423-processed-gene-0.21-mRNA-1//-1//CDS//3329541329//6973//frame0
MQEKSTSVLSIRQQPVYLIENWKAGIGGGLWSTGLALAHYLDTEHAQSQLKRVERVIELGSGNGFLAVCLLKACPALKQVVVTDTEEHLDLIRSNLKANGFSSDNSQVHVQEFVWGKGPLADQTPELGPFNLIIGSDLAYRDELHDPLIQAILDVDVSRTNRSCVTLLGVTMNDTKPIFFDKLTEAGLIYERLADHLLEPKFRGTNFGLFSIQRKC